MAPNAPELVPCDLRGRWMLMEGVEMNECLATRRGGDRFKPHEHEFKVVLYVEILAGVIGGGDPHQ